MSQAAPMKPLDPAAAAYVTRHTSPDGRTVLDLVLVFEPEDFRELGGEHRARIYDGSTGETVLNLLRRSGRVTSFDWTPEENLLLTMQNGTSIRISLAQDSYALSTEGWAPRPLAEIQSQAPDHLGVPERVPPSEPERNLTRVPEGLRRIGWVLIVIVVVAGFILSVRDGSAFRHAHFPRVLFRGVH